MVCAQRRCEYICVCVCVCVRVCTSAVNRTYGKLRNKNVFGWQRGMLCDNWVHQLWSFAPEVRDCV
jgi:hypothetical protein